MCEVCWPCVLQGYFYYIFGFCFVVGMLTVLITIEVAIVCTYVQLCAEDYLWWYAPFLLQKPQVAGAIKNAVAFMQQNSGITQQAHGHSVHQLYLHRLQDKAVVEQSNLPYRKSAQISKCFILVTHL